MGGSMSERKTNCLWGCQYRYFGKNASAFVKKERNVFMSEKYQFRADEQLIGCNKCHRAKWVELK